MEPDFFKFKDKNVYDLDSLIQYDPSFFLDCLKRKRNVIIKKQIPKEHYFYVKITKLGWVEIDSNYLRAKILVTEDWAKTNITKFIKKYSYCKK
jgi:hypothetical protein